MKNSSFIPIITLALSLIACKQSNNKWDTIGLFEQTEVIVPAESCGSLIYLNATEGQTLFKDSIIGLIDTTLLGLQKMELLIDRDTSMSRRTDITKKISDIEKQISWQKTEKIRLENLVALNSATRKQVNDTDDNISTLEKELASEHILLEKTNTILIDKSIAFGQQISSVEEMIHKCLISSPINGTLLIKYSNVGDHITTGRPIFSVTSGNNISLRAYATPEMLQQIHINQIVTVYTGIDNEKPKEYNGVITWISSVIEPMPENIKTRSKIGDQVYAIKISIENDETIKKGTYGSVKLKGISISK